MKRIFKFRAFVEGKMIQNPAITFWSDQPDDPIEVEGYSPLDKDVQCVLMQFTGLLDKNGKEIYESDILDYGIWDKGDAGGERAVVAWHEKIGRFGLDFYSKYGGEGYTGHLQSITDYLNISEVLGNIYEHPDLLNQNEERV